MNIEKSAAFLYTPKFKRTISLAIALKRIKYLEVNLIKEVNSLYTENYITLMQKRRHKSMEGYSVYIQWKN